MEYGNGPRRLKNLSTYLVGALKFYDLKNEKLTRIIFVLILFISFLSAFVPDKAILSIPANLAGVTVVYLASAAYLAAFIKDLKGEKYSIKSCLELIASKAPAILASSVIYMATLAFTFGLIVLPDITVLLMFLLIIPIVIVYMAFLFNVCYLLDKDMGVLHSYRASRRTTSGLKGSLFARVMGFNFLVAVPMSFVWIIALSSGNVLIANFVLAFAAAITNLMQQRLTVLMYMDLEYGENNQFKS